MLFSCSVEYRATLSGTLFGQFQKVNSRKFALSEFSEVRIQDRAEPWSYAVSYVQTESPSRSGVHKRSIIPTGSIIASCGRSSVLGLWASSWQMRSSLMHATLLL